MATPASPLGKATLSVASGFAPLPGTPNPLADRPCVLLRHSYGDALAVGGVTVPQGVSPYKYVATACSTQSPDCPKIMAAIKTDSISAVRADATGQATLPGVPPGTYYLMISTVFNRQPLVRGQAVQLNAGANTIVLDQQNAAPLN